MRGLFWGVFEKSRDGVVATGHLFILFDRGRRQVGCVMVISDPLKVEYDRFSS